METSWLWIRSLTAFICRRRDFNLVLASSLISSSERMQRRISEDRGVRGSSMEK